MWWRKTGSVIIDKLIISATPNLNSSLIGPEHTAQEVAQPLGPKKAGPPWMLQEPFDELRCRSTKQLFWACYVSLAHDKWVGVYMFADPEPDLHYLLYAKYPFCQAIQNNCWSDCHIWLWISGSHQYFSLQYFELSGRKTCMIEVWSKCAVQSVIHTQDLYFLKIDSFFSLPSPSVPP